MSNTVPWRTLFMLEDSWMLEMLDILLTIFSVYLFFLYFSIFFQKKKGRVHVLIGGTGVIVWQLAIFSVIGSLPAAWNLCISMVIIIFAVVNIFEGKILMKCFFSITFAALWMLVEILIGDLFMIYIKYW